jgi:hypothetical protein
MARLIDADKFSNFIKDHLPAFSLEDPFDGYRDVLQMLGDETATPTEDVAPIVKAHWTESIWAFNNVNLVGSVPWKCSNCETEFGGGYEPPIWNYCPSCGAKMDEGK